MQTTQKPMAAANTLTGVLPAYQAVTGQQKQWACLSKSTPCTAQLVKTYRQ